MVALASGLLLLPRGDDGLLGLPELAAGEVAPRTVKSPRAFAVVDPIATELARQQARRNVVPVFDHLLDVGPARTQDFLSAFDRAVTATGADDRAETFVRNLGVDTPPGSIRALFKSDDLSTVRDGASMLLEALFRERLVHDASLFGAQPGLAIRSIDANGRVREESRRVADEVEVLGPNQARAHVDALAADRLEHLAGPTRAAVAKVSKALLTHNFIPNLQETRRRRGEAGRHQEPIYRFASRGQRILRSGERVMEEDLFLLDELVRLESPQARLQMVLGSAVLGVLLAFLAYRSARHAYRHRLPKKRDLVFLASLFVTYLLLMWVGFKLVELLGTLQPFAAWSPDGYRWLLPLAAVAMVVRMAAGPVAATATAPVAGLLAGWMMDGDLDFAAYALAGALAAASTEPGPKRTILVAGGRAGFAQAMVVFGTALLGVRFSWGEVSVQAVLAFASGGLSALLARSVMPAVETLFGYTTPTGLAAFADAEHPLLRELLVEVPGTYHHSLHVGALAEAGAQAIGSDRLLARVGGYLHDVGRMKRSRDPEARRKEAARLAGEHRFPSALAQILAEQPHELGPGLRRIKPRSKTSALVALADRVEGALAGREGEFGDAEALEAVVRDEIRSAVSDRILDEAALELRELAAVSKAFTETLGPRFLVVPELTSGAWPAARPGPRPS